MKEFVTPFGGKAIFEPDIFGSRERLPKWKNATKQVRSL